MYHWGKLLRPIRTYSRKEIIHNYYMTRGNNLQSLKWIVKTCSCSRVPICAHVIAFTCFPLSQRSICSQIPRPQFSTRIAHATCAHKLRYPNAIVHQKLFWPVFHLSQYLYIQCGCTWHTSGAQLHGTNQSTQQRPTAHGTRSACTSIKKS